MAGNLILRSSLASAGGGNPPEQIIWETAFPDLASVVNFIFNSDFAGGAFDPTQSSSDSQRITWRPNEGPSFGVNAMRIEDTTAPDDEIHALWGRTFDPAKTAGDNSFSYVISPGTPIYVRGRVMMSQNRLNNDTGTGLKIVSITASANHTNTNQECFLGRDAGRINPSIIGATSASPPWQYNSLGGSDFDLMPGYNGGSSCLYSDVVGSGDYSGCWVFRAEEWMNYQITLISGGIGGANNTYVKLEMAYLEDTTWTKVFERSNLNISSDNGGYEFCNGHAMVGLWNRNENHEGLPAGCNHWFTDTRLSLTHSDPFSPITRPPSWFRNATVLRPINVPGTATGTLLAANGSLPGNFLSFSGMAVDQVGRGLWMVRNGGHNDYYGNEAYYCDLLQETCSWTKIMNGSPVVDGSVPGPNSVGYYADGSSRADHTYNIQVCTAPGEVYFGGFGAMASGPGHPSSSAWKWRLSDLGNGRNGYTWLGKALTNLSSLNTVNSCGCYDYRTGKYYFVAQDFWEDAAGAGGAGVWSIDTRNGDTIQLIQSHDGSSEFPVWCAIVPHLNSMVVGCTNQSLKILNLSTLTWTEKSVTGSGPDSWYYHAAYYEQGRQIIGWQEDGNKIRVLTVPNTVGGTWTWNLINLTSGGITIPGTSGDETGTHSRFNVMGNMGNGQGCIFYQRGRNNALIAIPLPRGPIT